MGDLKPFAESLKFTQAVNELGNVINLEQGRYVFFIYLFKISIPESFFLCWPWD